MSVSGGAVAAPWSRGLDRFFLKGVPNMARNKDWQKENFEKYRTSVAFHLRRVADEVEQLKIDPDSLGSKNELDLAQQIIRSEEHTSELQSRVDLVCRLLL